MLYALCHLLPDFLAPLKQQHHNTTTEQQILNTPARQPSEEEYSYPAINEKYFLRFIYIKYYKINYM